MKQKDKTWGDLKFFPTGSNWKAVLLEIYRNSPHNYGESHKMGFYEDMHPIAKKLKISGYELGLAISFLRDNQLIKDNNKLTPLNLPQFNANWSNMVFLTDKGFEVATKLENELSNQKTQNVLMIVTVVIAWTGFIGLIKELFPDRIPLLFWIYVSISLILLISFYFDILLKEIRRLLFNLQIKNQKGII